MQVQSSAVLAVTMVAMVACGGGNKQAKEPEEEPAEEESNEDVFVSELKMESIRSTFERKAKTVAPCFPEALEAGEVGNDDKVKLSVGLTITKEGRPTNLEILGASKRSQTLEACVLNNVGRWEFTELPTDLKYSYGFVLQRF